MCYYVVRNINVVVVLFYCGFFLRACRVVNDEVRRLIRVGSSRYFANSETFYLQ